MPHRLLLADETLLAQLTAVVRHDRAEIIEHRLVRHRKREPGSWEMALEIKGLKGKALKAGAMFDRLNVAYDKLIETGTAHATDVESLPGQIEGMQDDLQFMVQTLGNSVNGSGQGASGKPVETPATKVPDITLGELTAAPETAAGPPIAHTFRAEAERQIAASRTAGGAGTGTLR